MACPGAASRLTSLAPRPAPSGRCASAAAGPASTPARILASTFSNTRGTLQMKSGRTSWRFSASRSRLSANAVDQPLMDADERLEPREGVSQGQEQQVDVALPDPATPPAPPARRQVVAVRLDHALGCPWCPGVDDRGDVVRAHARQALGRSPSSSSRAPVPAPAAPATTRFAARAPRRPAGGSPPPISTIEVDRRQVLRGRPSAFASCASCPRRSASGSRRRRPM